MDLCQSYPLITISTNFHVSSSWTDLVLSFTFDWLSTTLVGKLPLESLIRSVWWCWRLQSSWVLCPSSVKDVADHNSSRISQLTQIFPCICLLHSLRLTSCIQNSRNDPQYLRIWLRSLCVLVTKIVERFEVGCWFDFHHDEKSELDLIFWIFQINNDSDFINQIFIRPQLHQSDVSSIEIWKIEIEIRWVRVCIFEHFHL